MPFSSFKIPKNILLMPAVMVLGVLAGAIQMRADLVRVSEIEAKHSVLSKVAPTLPSIAKQAHISGRVLVDLTVSEDGSVEKVDVVSGNPILGSAAMKAGKSWTFSPFKGPDGKPTKAIVRV